MALYAINPSYGFEIRVATLMLPLLNCQKESKEEDFSLSGELQHLQCWPEKRGFVIEARDMEHVTQCLAERPEYGHQGRAYLLNHRARSAWPSEMGSYSRQSQTSMGILVI
jgi:hypothetical protein